MKITYLGHAGFLVETNGFLLATDPWLSQEGAFDSSWFQFPCNHDLAPLVRERFRDPHRKRFIYISHEHRDHFDPKFLKTLPLDEVTFIVPRFQRAALREELASLHPGNLILCDHGQKISLPDGEAKLYLDDSGINRDSGVLIRACGETFLNLNDCKLYDELPSIARAEGPISVLTCQFSGATWHPVCYDYDREEYQRISRKKLLNKFEMVARAIEAVRPQTYLPSAGPACFLDPTLIHLNFEPVNIFPRAPQLLQYLTKRLPHSETRFVDVIPGDVVNARTGGIEVGGAERLSEAELEGYIRTYAERYRGEFALRQKQPSEEQAQEILDRLSVALQRKLDAFELCKRLKVSLFFGLSDVAGKLLRIDFPTRSVEQVYKISQADFYSLTTPSWQITRVLDGALTWEEFALTFRVRLNRKPDVYQTLIQGFLLLEPEDMNWFCQKLLDLEQNRARTIVEAGGIRYSIDRYCPHQGGDLCQGWADEGRLWTCPRHRWQFALDKNGESLTSSGSIHAVCLEND